MKYQMPYGLSYAVLGAVACCFTLVAWKGGPHPKPGTAHIFSDTIPLNKTEAQGNRVLKSKHVKRSFSELSVADWQKIAEQTEINPGSEQAGECEERRRTGEARVQQQENPTRLKEKGRLNINGN
jgi:hypothetical protein